jgi:excinuclease ABC subunit C
VDRLFPSKPFTDFGPNYLQPEAGAVPLQQVHGQRVSQLRGRVRQLGPKKPGVYGMLNAKGELIYVGKAKDLRTRLLCYFRPRSRDPKAGRIIKHVVSILWEISPNEFAALHRELELIRRWRPRFNVQGQPDWHRPIYLCLGRLPAPYLFLDRRPPKDVLSYYGPVPNGRRVKEAARRLNDWFRLRDCAQTQEMHFADQGQLFPLELSHACLRYEIGTCLGPCAATCGRGDYFDAVRSVQNFLEGKDLTILQTLQHEKAAAAEKQIFERAAAYRDRLASLLWLHQQLDQMRRLRSNSSFIYPLTGKDGHTFWYLIHAGQTITAIAEPQDAAARQRARNLIDAVYRKEYFATREQTLAQRDSILLVASWFNRYPEERGRTLAVADALARVHVKAD